MVGGYLTLRKGVSSASSARRVNILCPLRSRPCAKRSILSSFTWSFFLPHDAMHKGGLCCRPVSVCLSVRPSVTLMYFIDKAEDIVKFLSRSGSPIILVFWPPAPALNSKGNPFSRAAKYTGGGKNFAIFHRNRRLSRKWYEIGPWLLPNVNRKSSAVDRSVLVPMTSSDLERRDIKSSGGSP